MKEVEKSGARWEDILEDHHVELYNVIQDESEEKDLSQIYPEIADGLRKKLYLWYKEVGARMPVDNPHYVSPVKDSDSFENK